jgi:hypothetical protein
LAILKTVFADVLSIDLEDEITGEVQVETHLALTDLIRFHD